MKIAKVVVVLGVSRRAASACDSVWNGASFSRFCAGEWVRQFGCNSHNLWHFGLGRLGLDVGTGRGSPPALLRTLRCFGSRLLGDEAQALRAVQCALSEAFPPFGLFRAQLLPGCCT